jgi:hypothetical protein
MWCFLLDRVCPVVDRSERHKENFVSTNDDAIYRKADGCRFLRKGKLLSQSLD